MCGIAGFYNLNSINQPEVLINVMISKLIHRGPDDSGTYINSKVSLGHRRLSILDLSSSGHQPMFTPDKDLVIVFNGEIYNFLELKQDLLELGHSFKSRTDTEVILNGFRQWGTALFNRLNGIFAFALWDSKNEDLYLVKDRLGVKPLYIYQSQDVLYFASEIKAIRAVCPELDHIDKAAFSAFLYYGNALGNKTLYKSVKSLSPGHFLIINKTGVKKQIYWDPEKLLPIQLKDENNIIQHTNYLIEQAVKRQLISDVPVGVFLSGGIDSSAIVAFASRYYPGKLKTFSAAFEFETGENELAKAKSVAEYFGTDHREFFIGAKDLPDVIENMVYHHDEPFSDAANIPLYLMAQQVKPFVTVVLQGDGGDEIFAGYRRYQLLQRISSFPKRKLMQLLNSIFADVWLKNSNLKRIKRMINALGQQDDAMLMALLLTVDTLKQNTFESLNPELQKQIDNYDPFEQYKIENSRFADKDLVQRMLYIDSQIILPNTFLEKVDKSTMAASVEVRVPLLDNELVNYVMALPSAIKLKGGEKKWLLKKALRDIVPDKILDSPKTGFGVPYENWLRKPLYNMMNDHFRTAYITNTGLFDYKKLDKMIKEHKESTANHGFALWKLMNLCIWMEMNKVLLN